MTELIDYAGLFPPAKLPIEKAVSNYHYYINSSDSWMLGKFVISASRLHELNPFRNQFNDQMPLRLSVILSAQQDFNENLAAILDFLSVYDSAGSIEAIEIPTSLHLEYSNIEELEKRLGKLIIFFEESISEEPSTLLDELQWMQPLFSSNFGIKLRMGGNSSESIPQVGQTAKVIEECRNRGLYIKFTAGLHSPITEFSPNTRLFKYGFFNVFVASIMTYCRDVDNNIIQSILLEKDPSNFIISAVGLSWRNFVVSSLEINIARNLFASSFGSCSFDEPRIKLGELHLFHEMKEGFLVK